MKPFLILTAAILLLSFTKGENAEQQIRNNMAKQQDAWNYGDIKSFMLHYWNDPQLKFIGKNGVTLGWGQTLANYKKAYPDKAAMGQLAFELSEVRELDKRSAFAIGSWELSYTDKEPVGGYFSLIWELKNGQWVITVDHTS